MINKMIEVIPAILTNDPQELKQLINKAEEVVDRVQIDVLDGQFAKNKTVDPSIFETIETNLKLDFHLMTKEPVDWIEKATRAMANRVVGQIEMMESQMEFVEKAIEMGTLTGLAVGIDTPISDLDPEVFVNLDAVLVMSVPAGFGGQKFDDKAVGKIKSLNKMREKENLEFKICVDGGVTTKVIKSLAEAGVDEVFVGKRLFDGDLRENIEEFKKVVNR